MPRPTPINAIAGFLIVFFICSITYPLYSSPLLEKYDPAPQLLNSPIPMIVNSVVGAGYSGPSYVIYNIFYLQFPADANSEGLSLSVEFGTGFAALAGALGILKGKAWGKNVVMAVVLLELSFCASLLALPSWTLLPTFAYSVLILLYLSRFKARKHV